MSAPAPLAFSAASTRPVSGLSGQQRPSTASPAPLPTRITRYLITVDEVPVDFFADPDGCWEFSSLVEMAGFNPEHPGASVGALTQPFDGFPEGAAVITEVGAGCRYVAIAQLPAETTGAMNTAMNTSVNNATSAAGNRRADLSRAGMSRGTSSRIVSPRRPHRAA